MNLNFNIYKRHKIFNVKDPNLEEEKKNTGPMLTQRDAL